MVEGGADLSPLDDDRLGRFVLDAEPVRDVIRDLAVGEEIEVGEERRFGMARGKGPVLVQSTPADRSGGRVLEEDDGTVRCRQRGVEVGEGRNFRHRTGFYHLGASPCVGRT